MRSRQLVCLLLIAASLTLSGCGGQPAIPKGVILTGRLLNNGQAMELVRPDVGLGMVEVTLLSNSPAIPREFGKTDKDGRFEIRGPGNGVKPGTYKLAVRHWKEGKGKKDELNDRFTAEKTPIVIEVPEKKIGGKQDLGDIELSTYEEKKS
ncbi:MAG TPA: hypothetical protein VGM98_05575 [Schlesneria sp.]|jgi:hypothetical protein